MSPRKCRLLFIALKNFRFHKGLCTISPRNRTHSSCLEVLSAGRQAGGKAATPRAASQLCLSLFFAHCCNWFMCAQTCVERLLTICPSSRSTPLLPPTQLPTKGHTVCTYIRDNDRNREGVLSLSLSLCESKSERSPFGSVPSVFSPFFFFFFFGSHSQQMSTK